MTDINDTLTHELARLISYDTSSIRLYQRFFTINQITIFEEALREKLDYEITTHAFDTLQNSSKT